MSITDDAKNLAQEAKGNIKEGAGKVSDNERLEAEGKGLSDERCFWRSSC